MEEDLIFLYGRRPQKTIKEMQFYRNHTIGNLTQTTTTNILAQLKNQPYLAQTE
jgi:hypothetical protein